MGGASADVNFPNDTCSLDMELVVDNLLLEVYELLEKEHQESVLLQ